MRKLLIPCCGLIAIIALARPMIAQDKDTAQDKVGQEAGEAMDKVKAAGDKAGDEAMKKMMEEYMKIAAPGENHKLLNPLAGKWQAAGRFRMTPDAPWTESKSEADSEWVLGGRFLLQKVKGDPMMGMPQPFEGLGLMGYDNGKKKFIFSWADNMGTMIMAGEGSADSTGKTITFMSNCEDPMTKKPTSMKSVYKVESNDKYVLQMYQPAPDGKEFLAMEIVNTRKK